MNETNDTDEIYFFLKKFGGRLTQKTLKDAQVENIQREYGNKKQYRKHIVNRWHVLVRLARNKELIPFRHHNIRKKEQLNSVSFVKSVLIKVKSICKIKKQ